MHQNKMTHDEIIRITHQAGLHLATDVKWMPIIGLEYAEKLIQLAAAEEREACAKVCDARVIGDHNREDREAKRCAEAIRARSKA